MSATRIHLPRLTGSEIRRVGMAMARVVRDSTETDEIVVAEEITSQAQLTARTASTPPLMCSALVDRGSPPEDAAVSSAGFAISRFRDLVNGPCR